MALATQCPHCHTTFRVAHDQLKLRTGMVRCGQCRQVFNGIEHLLPVKNPAGSGDAGGLILPGATTPPAAPAAMAGHAATGLRRDTKAASPFASPANASAPPVPHAEPGNILDELDYDALSGMTLMHLPPEETPDTPAKPEEAPPAAAAPTPHAPLRTEPYFAPITASGSAAAPLPAAIWRTTAPASAANVQKNPPPAAREDDAQEEEPGFVTAARRQQHQAPRSRLLFGSGAIILGLILLAQTTYALRNPLAAHLPQAKPALLALCHALGCSIALPAQIEAISIESSELQAQPDGSLTLALLLRNRSSTVQAWPNIELTLNDGTERPILRRVFAPREFPLAAAASASGFAADSEKSVRLTFALIQAKPAGYRAVLFYP